MEQAEDPLSAHTGSQPPSEAASSPLQVRRLSLSVLHRQAASTLLVVGLKKSFLRTIKIMKDDYPVSGEGREKGKTLSEKRKFSVRAKRDKALLRMNTPRGKRSGQKNACRQWGEGGVRRCKRRPWDRKTKPFNWEKRSDSKSPERFSVSRETEIIFTPGVRGNED